MSDAREKMVRHLSYRIGLFGVPTVHAPDCLTMTKENREACAGSIIDLMEQAGYSKRTPGGEAEIVRRLEHTIGDQSVSGAHYLAVADAAAALSTRPAGESAGVAEALCEADMRAIFEAPYAHVKITWAGDQAADNARAVKDFLAARASQPSAGEVA